MARNTGGNRGRRSQERSLGYPVTAAASTARMRSGARVVAASSRCVLVRRCSPSPSGGRRAEAVQRQGNEQGRSLRARRSSPRSLQRACSGRIRSEMVDVIVQSCDERLDVETKDREEGSGDEPASKLESVASELVKRQFDAVRSARRISMKLASVSSGLIVHRPDAPMRPRGAAPDTAELATAPTSSQLWPYESGVSTLWTATPRRPTIAIVDSGIDASAPTSPVASSAQVNFVTLGRPELAPATGAVTARSSPASRRARLRATPAPLRSADIVSLDVMDDQGQAKTSDVIAAAEWILQNKATYNIRVANFSLHSGCSGRTSSVDPLEQAVEKLWLTGVVVVAAAGNYGIAGGPSGVQLRSRQRPVRDHGRRGRHRRHLEAERRRRGAPWSAYGHTPDGFLKPEICAPGRYMVGPIPAGSTLAAQKADKLVGARLHRSSPARRSRHRWSRVSRRRSLARHPSWTPDQVKGALMRRARAVPHGLGRLVRRRPGQRRAVGAGDGEHAPNPNQALEQVPVTTARRRDDGVRRGLAGRTCPGATSPGTRSPGATCPGATSPGMRSPGATSPGRTCPGAMSPGRTSRGRTAAGATPPGRRRLRADAG